LKEKIAKGEKMSLINVGEDTFQKEVMESEKLVIADFWASWCMPCKMVEPVLEKLAELYENDVKIVRVNVDEQS
jgi:thioredoxin 1